MPSSHTALDFTKPDGATQAGPAFSQSARDQLQVALIAAGIGSLESMLYSQSGGTAQYPGVQLWTSGVYRVRRTLTWGTSGGQNNNITVALVEWSNDSGVTWATVASEGRSYDSNGNLTSTTGSGGVLSWVEALFGRFASLLATVTGHIAGTGTGVHGLAGMATQAPAAVAITGGAIDGVALGGTTPAAVNATKFTGTRVALGTLAASQNIDWSAGDYFTATIGNATAITWTNLPPAGRIQGITLELVNPGAFAITGAWATTKWPGGVAPTRTASGTDLYEFSCADGSTVRGAQAQKDSR